MDLLFDLNILRFICALGIVLIGAWGVIFLTKRFRIFPSTQREGKYLHLMDMLPLDAQRRLAFVSCDQRVVLVLLSPKGDVMIALPSSAPQEK